VLRWEGSACKLTHAASQPRQELHLVDAEILFKEPEPPLGILFLFNSLQELIDDISPRPPGKTLDRINNDGHYERGDVRWATYREQALNKSTTGKVAGKLASARLTYKERTLTLKQWSEEVGIGYRTLAERLKKGRTPEDVLFKPTQKWRRITHDGLTLSVLQ
jgi:hypothetical protein